MAQASEWAPWIALTRIPGLGAESIRNLLQALGGPEQVLAATPSQLQPHVKPAVAEAIRRGAAHEEIARALDWLAQTGNHLVTLADAEYPRSLLQIPDPPVLLYAKGRLELLNRPSIAVVGSRNATPQGLNHAESFSEALSQAGLTIVSGMAHGIDAAAHRGGLNGSGSSIAVLGTGIDRVYPAANRALAHALAEKGLLVSEFHPGTPPLAPNFPRRNRIISGLSLGCLVVEASLRSGSLITARMALEQGREIFAIPGSIHSPLTHGCHQLIKQGAKLAESVQDILDELGLDARAQPAPARSGHPLLEHLGFDPVDFDTLLQRSGLTIEALSAILLQLELEGCVSPLPGGLYQRIF